MPGTKRFRYSDLEISRFPLALETVSTPAWISFPNGTPDSFNRHWLEFTGLTSEDARNGGLKQALHPHDLPRLLEMTQTIVKSGRPFELEVRLRRSDGTYRWFHSTGIPKQDVDGRVVRWYHLLVDIELRKLAEEAIRATEHQYRLMVESIPGLIHTTTPTGELEYFNQRLLDYFGRTLEELKNWGTNDIVHPDDLPRVNGEWRISLETGRIYEMENRLRRADGVYRWFHFHGHPARDHEGRIIRWVFLLTDIEDRKKVELDLKRSEALLLEAESLGHTGYWSLDPTSGRVTTSPEMFRAFGVREGEDCSSPDFWFGRIHPEDRNRVRQTFEASVRDKTKYQENYRILLPDGTVMHQLSIGKPVLDESGHLQEFIGTAMDTTEQVRAREALESALAEVKTLRDQLYKENLALRDEVDRVSMFEEIVGTSPSLQEVLSRVVKVAPTDSSVLITGETGTGKELIARAIHKRSPRAQRAFVSVNCAALSSSLISSELFGHEKGAFSGATQRRLGRFELANGGTIFLDEVGELPPDTQVSLLRVLQEREFERVGGTESVRVDLRVIAATNRDLRAAQTSGTFRPDLFYRLNIFPIEVPPLRDRKDDILTLLEYYVRRYANMMGKGLLTIDRKTMDLFRSYAWPGNVRELQNIVERSVILSSEGVFSVDEYWLSQYPEAPSAEMPEPTSNEAEAEGERTIIEAALAKSRGRVWGPTGAAAKLCIPPSTLDARIKKLNIRKSTFKFRKDPPL